MKKVKLVFFILSLILLVGCKTPVETVIPNEDPGLAKDSTITVEKATQQEQDNIVREYYNLLTNNTSKEEQIRFIDDNIGKLDEINADAIIISFEEFLVLNFSNWKENYNLLNKYNIHLSEEVKSYLSILTIETNKNFSDGEEIKVDINEILNRALASENYIDNYPNSKTITRIKELYNAYIEGAIIGTGNQYIYAEDGSSTIKKEVLNTYSTFIDNNKDSKTSYILSQYIKILESNHNDMNSQDVNIFYDEIPQIIKESFRNKI